jgi:RNA polymerase sigma factor, sigma-70 family
MHGLNAVLKTLTQWFQATARRFLELPQRRIIKRSFNNTYPDMSASGGSDDIDQIEARLLYLIANRKLDEALEDACKAYGEDIKLRCRRMLHPYTPNPFADGQDLAQQVFLEFWRTLRVGKYDPSEASVRSFLHHIASRRIIDKLRTPNRIVPGRDTELGELDRRDLRESMWTNPETWLLEDEERKILKRELERLPLPDRLLLNWHYKLGHSAVKIAQITGEKAGTIRSQISRACGKLREICNSDR